MTNVKRMNDIRLGEILATSTSRGVEELLASLPVVDSEEYHLDYGKVVGTWREGYLHWLPVGLDRGNGGRVKLAGQPMNPIAERLVNGKEALIELERLRELAENPNAPMPKSVCEKLFILARADEASS